MTKKRALRKLNIRLRRMTNFSGHSLQAKLLINHFLLIIIPVLTIFYFIYSFYTNDKRREAENLTHIANEQAMNRIDSLIDAMEELTKQPVYDAATTSQSPKYRDPTIMDILKESNKTGAIRNSGDGIIPDSKGNDPTYAKTTTENMVVLKLLKRILLFNDNIHSVFLFNRYGQYELQAEQYSLTGTLKCNDEDWFAKCISLNGGTYLFVGDVFTKNIRTFADRAYDFSVARAVMDSQSVKPLGIVCINVDKSFLRETCNSIMTMPGERILVLDDLNRMVYDSADSDTASVFDQSGFKLPAADAPAGEKSITIGGRKYLIDVVNSEHQSWKLVHIIPEEKLFTSIKAMQQQFMLLILISVFLSMFLSISLTYGVTKPMKKLITTMRIVEKGDLSVRFHVRRKDEIGLLGRSFNKMIRKIDNLINAVYISQIRKKEAELDALQTQINPHFIYNTLESIRMMAELNDDSETSRMTFMLARLLRYSISVKKQKVTVRQEVDHLRNYLELQNMRYDGKFELKADLDDDLLNMNIIKLVFQPIVENAIVHGLEGIEGKGVIRVSGYHDDNGSVVFRIEDNGKGIPADQLDELNRKIGDFTAGEGDKGSVGLKNINERIQLHYGEGFGIRLESLEGRGTTVILEFPDIQVMNRLTVG